jgi:gamma-glutamylcyclotransferase (GGCT)/AIG2-like uncharacterized protein YtfP
MNIFNPVREEGNVLEALYHCNHARDIRDRSQVEVAGTLFDALNKLQTEWRIRAASEELPNEEGRPIGEVEAFKRLHDKILVGPLREHLLASEELRALAEFEPKIWNHDTLFRNGWAPSQEMPENLLKKATDEHRGLVVALSRFHTSRSPDNERQVIRRAAGLLYVVRSNLKHGEKTPSGPDREKRRRDETVCQSVVPLLLLLVDLFFGRPSTRLATYGTLRPGEANHAVISKLTGVFEPCVLRGEVEVRNGVPVLLWNGRADRKVEGHLLESEDLPAFWAALEEFEGPEYVRHLVFAEGDSKRPVVANAFVARD